MQRVAVCGRGRAGRDGRGTNYVAERTTTLGTYMSGTKFVTQAHRLVREWRAEVDGFIQHTDSQVELTKNRNWPVECG